jgi:hypothetical protein
MKTLRATLTLSLLASALALTSCGTMPTSPTSAIEQPGRTSSPAAVLELPEGSPDGDPALPFSTTAVIKGQDGGVIVAGAFKLTIPKNAYNGNATITLRQPNPNVLEAEVQVLPLIKNRFVVPATLTADASSLSAAQLSQASMWAVSPASGQFEPVAGSSVDVPNKRVSAPFTKLAKSKVKSN